MNQMENIDIEWKQEYSESIKKDVIAFSNTEGGAIYIGVDDNGRTVGVTDPDETMLQVANTIRDSIRPDIMPFIHIQLIERDRLPVIEVRVSVGTNRPYYLLREGLRPKGVYVRKGSSCQPLSDQGIRDMIRETSGKSYEDGRSMNQELTFETFSKELAVRSIAFGTAQMKTLKLIGEDGLYTNLGLLLSDQCQHTIKVAVFQGAAQEVFRNREEFGGSLLQQMNDAYAFLERYNSTRADFKGLYRSDIRDYPEEALREALLNSIIHRDYSFGGSTVINVYDDRIEFLSLGGLVPGLSMDAVFLGISQSRNPGLAAVFYRMRLVESYGTGIRRIRRLYEELGLKAEFRTAEGGFAVTLPNSNTFSRTMGGDQEELRIREPLQTFYSGNPVGRVSSNGLAPSRSFDNRIGIERSESLYGGGTANEASTPAGSTQLKEEIYSYALTQGSITRKEIEDQFHLKTTKTYKLLLGLVEEGRLRQIKNGRLTTYEPVTDSGTVQI